MACLNRKYQAGEDVIAVLSLDRKHFKIRNAMLFTPKPDEVGANLMNSAQGIVCSFLVKVFIGLCRFLWGMCLRCGACAVPPERCLDPHVKRIAAAMKHRSEAQLILARSTMT